MDGPLATKCVELMHQGPAEPFLLVASSMNLRDVCYWIRGHEGIREYDSTAQFPPAPGNMWRDPDEPEYLQHHRYGNFNLTSNSLHISKAWKADDFPALHPRLLPHVRGRRSPDWPRALAAALWRIGREHGSVADLRPRRGARCPSLDSESSLWGGDRQGSADCGRQGRRATHWSP